MMNLYQKRIAVTDNLRGGNQQLPNHTRRSRGFTLLEIIIVITILSILTAASIPLVRNTVKRERESELRLALRQLRQALDAYKRFADTNPNAIPIEWKTD